MERFSKDIEKILLTTSDSDNKWAYSSLLMFCEFHTNYQQKPEIIEDKGYLKALYFKYHFGGVQREKDIDLENREFINAYFSLMEGIDLFYSFDINHIEIIELNIKTIAKNTEKPYKTGLLDFLNYIKFFKEMARFGLGSYINIIEKNKKFFIMLLNYVKDISSEYIDCKKEMEPFIVHYIDSALPLLWIIQKLLSSHHFECVERIMTKLFDRTVYLINSEFMEALIKLMTFNIVEKHAKIYIMFISKFITQYGEKPIEDFLLNECKVKESHVEVCPINDIGIRICDNVPEEFKVDPAKFCKSKTHNKFLKNYFIKKF